MIRVRELKDADPITAVAIEELSADPAFDELFSRIVAIKPLTVRAERVTAEEPQHFGRRPEQIRTRQHRLLFTFTVAAAISVMALVLSSGSEPPVPTFSDLGMQITSYVPPPRPLDDALTFGFLPPGFHLVSDRQVNTLKPGAIHYYDRIVVFRGSGARADDQLVAQVNPDPSYVAAFGNTGSSRVTSRPVRVAGHRASLQELVPLNLPPWMRIYNANTPHIPNAIAPGVPSSSRKPDIAVSWTIGDQSFDANPSFLLVRGQGASTAEVLRFANNLAYNPAVNACLLNGSIVRTTGLCAPGEFTSPPGLPPLLPSHSTRVGHGTLHGLGWALAVEGPGPFHGFVGFFNGTERFGDDFMLGSSGVRYFGPTGSLVKLPRSDLGVIVVATSLSGDRFAYGVVSPSVTSVQSRSTSGAKLSAPVLSRQVAGMAFFVLYLGKPTGPSEPGRFCSNGSATISFLTGQTKAATIHLSGDGSSAVKNGTSFPTVCE